MLVRRGHRRITPVPEPPYLMSCIIPPVNHVKFTCLQAYLSRGNPRFNAVLCCFSLVGKNVEYYEYKKIKKMMLYEFLTCSYTAGKVQNTSRQQQTDQMRPLTDCDDSGK